jgi:two-component system OmpR family sensor kinase
MAVRLQRTLALRFSLTMGAALLAIAMWAYLGVRRSLLHQLEDSIQTTSQLQSYRLVETGAIVRLPPTTPEAVVTDINRLVVVRDSAGAVLLASTPLARGLPFDSTAFAVAAAGRTGRAQRSWRTETVLSIYTPVLPGSPPGALVMQVGASLSPTRTAARAILVRMLGTALLGSLFALAGSWWLSRSAIAPVAAIAAEAQLIQGHIGDQRISAHADVVELKGLIEVLNGMLSRVARTQEWHRRILNDLGHDLRTPLTAMRTGIQVALRHPRTPEEYQRVLQSTQEDIDRLQLITDSLSLLGQIESGKLKPQLASLDARTLVRDAVDRASGRLDGKHLVLRSPEEPVPARLDSRLMGLTVDQLIDNALQHTPAGTEVTVAVSGEAEQVRIVVEDNGPGVPPEILPDLFDRFYRGNTSRSRGSGAGLGLTTVAAVVALHHGKVTAEAGSNGGLRISMEVPAS